MPVPSNTTAETAIDIGATLPYTTTQTVDDGGTTYEVWYTYTAPVAGVIGVFGFGDLSVYTPRLWVYTGPASAPVAFPVGHQILSVNKPVEFSVTAGTTYLFRFEPFSGDVSPAVLTLSVLAAPTESVPAGSICVPCGVGDITPTAAALLAGSDGTILRFEDAVPAGEAGDVLTNGVSLVSDELTNQNCRLFSAAFEFLADVAVPTTAANQCRIRTHVSTQTFHAISNTTNPTVLYHVATDGTATAVAHPTVAARVVGLSVNAAETILYYVIRSNGTGIKRWDLTTDTAMPDLVAGTANTLPLDMMMLGDETLLTLFRQTTTDEVYALRHDASGTLLNTYSCDTDNGPEARMAYAINDPASFWIWHQPTTPGVSVEGRFVNLVVSDGSIVTEFTTQEFTEGHYEGATSADPQRFGPTISCPFFITRLNTPPPPTPTITTRVDPIRRVRQAPHLWDGHAGQRLFYPGFQLLVESGVLRSEDEPLTFFLQWSDDGGHTWSRLHAIQGSLIGQYRYRFWWRRLGQSRDRIFRVVNSDPAKIVVIDALLTPDPRQGAN